jgi:dolichyl-phosphate-mannose-protein mannosyltransferase
MAGHVLNHLIFDSQRLSPGARFIWFVIWTGSVIINFWWFKDFALGIYGPVNDHKGWLWRGSWNVSQAQEPVRATPGDHLGCSSCAV